MAEFVKKNGKQCINLTGHTDTRGSLSYNQALSERRVRSVANYLKSLDFKHDVTAANALGETHLAVAKEGDVVANRRVELRSYKCGAAAFPAGAVPAWLAAVPLVCLAGACDFSSSSSTSTTTTTTTTTTNN